MSFSCRNFSSPPAFRRRQSLIAHHFQPPSAIRCCPPPACRIDVYHLSPSDAFENIDLDVARFHFFLRHFELFHFHREREPRSRMPILTLRTVSASSPLILIFSSPLEHWPLIGLLFIDAPAPCLVFCRKPRASMPLCPLARPACRHHFLLPDARGYANAAARLMLSCRARHARHSVHHAQHFLLFSAFISRVECC